MKHMVYFNKTGGLTQNLIKNLYKLFNFKHLRKVVIYQRGI